MPLMAAFYQSPALATPMEAHQVERLWQDLVSGDFPVQGLALYSDGALAGFAVLGFYYSTENVGTSLQIEDLYIAPTFRRRGLAQAFFSWLKDQHPQVVRWRLEVTPDNHAAKGLYEGMGFVPMAYDQYRLNIAHES